MMPKASLMGKEQELPWRCFHCDEVLTSEHAARLHFGADETRVPACQIKGAEGGLVEALRRAENDAAEAWHAIHAETTDAAKAYHAQAARHSEQIRALEQVGYDRGIADAKAHPETLGLRRYSDGQAEVVGWRGKYRTEEKWKYFDRPFDGFDPDKYQIEPLYASPPSVAKGGVTIPSVDEIEAIILATEPDIPASVDGERIWTLRMAKGLHSALTAALAVGDEGIRVGWQPIKTARKVVDETVLLRIEHVNFAIAGADDKHLWEEAVTAYWTDHNTGGWVWHGLAGTPTHWQPIEMPRHG